MNRGSCAERQTGNRYSPIRRGRAKRWPRIRDLGVRISIDDFGAGFSSLSYIATQPIHALKIDRSFALNLMREPPLDVDRARSRVTVPKRRG